MLIKSNDGHGIVGIFEEAKGSKGIVILSHGITSEKNEGGLYSELAETLKEFGYSSYRFDYRGHGDSNISSKEITVSGEILDLYAVLQEFDRIGKKIYLISASFAASITLKLFENYYPKNLKKVAFLNPVTSYKNTFTSSNTSWAKMFFPQDGIASAIEASPIKVGSKNFEIGSQMIVELYSIKLEDSVWPKKLPLKLYHGYDDSIVSVKDTIAFSKRTNSPILKKTLYPNAGHGLEEVKDALFKDIVEYFDG